MPLPTGLIPVLAFALTVGVAVPVTLGAHLLHSHGNRPFATALRTALLAIGVVYLVGVAVVWVVAGGWPLWEVAAALLLAGAVSLVVLVALPLLVGREIVRRARDVDPETALRFVTDGWALVALVVFGIFVAPGRFGGGHLLHLEGERVCLVGFCGIAVPVLAAVFLELVVAVVGPGVVGLMLYSLAVRTRAPDVSTGP